MMRLEDFYLIIYRELLPRVDAKVTSITVSRICQRGLAAGHLDSRDPPWRAYLRIPTSEGALSQYAPRVP